MHKILTLFMISTISISFANALAAQDVAKESGRSNKQKNRTSRQKDDHGVQQMRRRGQQKQRPNLVQMFQRLDKNNDGKVTANEVTGKMAERMKMIDQNGDGVDREELLAAFRTRMQKGMGGPKGNAKEKGRDFSMIFKRADKNGDGIISKDEAPDRLKQRFDQIDVNGDGAIDGNELKELVSKLQNGASKKGKDGNKPQKPKRPGGNA